MSPPRHLWSGDWRRESDAAADELAKRRAAGAHTAPRSPAPAARPQPSAPPLRRARRRLPALRPPSPQHRRLALVIVGAALLLTGAVYGLSALGGADSPTASAVSSGRPWLGVELSNPVGGGVIVDSVAPGGPADRAGIEPGDVITQVSSKPVSSPGDVQSAIEGVSVGSRVEIVVLRGAMTYTTVATIAGARAGTP